MAAGTAVLSGAMESLIIRVDQAGHLSGGHHDNLSAILLQTKQESRLKETMSTKQKNLMIALAAVAFISILLNVFMFVKLAGGKDKKPTNQTEDQTEEIVQKVVEEMERRQTQVIETLKAKKDNPEELSKALDVETEKLDLKEELSEFITELGLIRDMKAGDDKLERLSKAKATLQEIQERAMGRGQDDQLDYVARELAKPITEGDSDKSKGQYNILIKSLRSIRNSI
jgi:hypothetical protein